MDISPDTSPSSRPSSCAGTPQLGPASTPNTAAGHHPSSTPSSSAPFIANIPQLINQINGGQNNQELTNKGNTSTESSKITFIWKTENLWKLFLDDSAKEFFLHSAAYIKKKHQIKQNKKQTE